eukprot:496665-Pelagomonas_calceolata.AAC.2
MIYYLYGTVCAQAVLAHSLKCSIEDAKRDCRHDWMREALDVWTKQLKATPTTATAAAAAAAATLVSTSVAAATD